MTAAVVVCADLSISGRHTLQWAAAEAHRRRTELLVLVTNGRARHEQRSSFAGVLAAVREAVPDVPVLGRASRGPVEDAFCVLSADADALVVPASLPSLARIVADSFCPVFSVPDGFSPPQEKQGPDVVGVAPWTGEAVIELAFCEAERHGAPLRAVRTWSDSRVRLPPLRPEDLLLWDTVDDQAQRQLERALSAAVVVHPDVHVKTMVVKDRAADFLLALSNGARLLVLGRSTRGALLAGIAGWPVNDLLRAAACPVLVVPEEGPPWTTWLPERNRASAITGR